MSDIYIIGEDFELFLWILKLLSNVVTMMSQWPVLGWVTKIYYFELLRASEGTLSRWSRLHLQSLAPTPVSRRVDVRQAAGRKKSLANLYHNMMKNMLYRPHLVG
jgi:hypothetical protein